MHIKDFIRQHNIPLAFTKAKPSHNSTYRHVAFIPGTDDMDENGNPTVFGNGVTPQEAIESYVQLIAGKTLTLTNPRRVLEVPADLTAEEDS